MRGVPDQLHQRTRIEQIAGDIGTHAPDAWSVVVANTVLVAIIYLARRSSGMKTMGLCQGYSGVIRLAVTTGLDRSRDHYDGSCVNPFV